MKQLSHCIPEGGLLQSSGWRDVYRARNKHVIIFDSGGYGVIEYLPLVGCYLYVPRYQCDIVSMAEAVEVARHERCGWLRFDASDRSELEELNQNYRIASAPHDMQPRTHIIRSLSGTEDEMLSSMKSKTRYNIRLAQKKGVVVHRVCVSDDDFPEMLDIFYHMVEETAARKGVQFHPKHFYQSIFDALSADQVALYMAEIEGREFVAANIVTFYGDTVTYLHGATGSSHRNLMAPFLLQWEAMRDGMQRNYRYYDFGGVYPGAADPGKQGITRFKQGFGQTEDLCALPGTHDIVLNNLKYRAYRLLQYLKSMRHP